METISAINAGLSGLSLKLDKQGSVISRGDLDTLDQGAASNGSSSSQSPSGTPLSAPFSSMSGFLPYGESSSSKACSMTSSSSGSLADAAGLQDAQPSCLQDSGSEQQQHSQDSGNPQICYDFTKGMCTRGDKCKYSHDIATIVHFNSKEKGICFDYLRSQCHRGLLCRFSHDLSNIAQQCQLYDGNTPSAPNNNRSSSICYDFVKGVCTRGSDCRYSHDLTLIARMARGSGDESDAGRQADVCFDYLRGRCTRGDACKYSHSASMLHSGMPQPAPVAGMLPPVMGLPDPALLYPMAGLPGINQQAAAAATAAAAAAAAAYVAGTCMPGAAGYGGLGGMGMMGLAGSDPLAAAALAGHAGCLVGSPSMPFAPRLLQTPKPGSFDGSACGTPNTMGGALQAPAAADQLTLLLAMQQHQQHAQLQAAAVAAASAAAAAMPSMPLGMGMASGAATDQLQMLLSNHDMNRLLHKGSAPNLHSLQGLSGSLPGSPAASPGPLQVAAAAAAGRLSMENMAAMHGSLPNQGMMHRSAAHANMSGGHSANHHFTAPHRAHSDSSLAAALAAASSLGSMGLGSGPSSPCSPAVMAAHAAAAAAAAANHSRGGSPCADLAALQAAAVGGASSSNGGGRLSRLSNSSSAFADAPGMGQPPRAGSALQGALPAAPHRQQQAVALHAAHLGRAHSAPTPGPLLAAQQQQALAPGKVGLAGKHESQQQMMQRMYGKGMLADRSTTSRPGLLPGRHAAAAGNGPAAVPFSIGMNIRSVAGGQTPAQPPMSPDVASDTVGVRDTGAAAATAYAAADVQAGMRQQATGEQQQALHADLAGQEGDSCDGDAHAPNLLPLIKEIWSR